MRKSVYNFVPAPEENEVFIPNRDGKNEVSHDLPFEDGESGEIEIKITAQTPIFIRNGHGKKDKEIYDNVTKKQSNSNYNPTDKEKESIDRYLSFTHFVKEDGKKEYFIPATSLKGMIRNTLEVFSFSRLKTEDDIFAFRNIDDKDYLNEQKKVKSGWLYKEGKQWKIQECEHDNISILDIEKHFEINLKGLDAVSKYNNIRKGEVLLRKVKVFFQKQLGFTRKKTGKFMPTTKLYQFKENDELSIEGKLVLYGAIDKKEREYVFHSDKSKLYNVSNDLIKRFIDIDNKLPKETSLWKYFEKNQVVRIPVFFYSQDNLNAKHFGFSKLYKRTHTKRLHELSPILSYKKEALYKPDLATTMFGEIDDNEKNNKEVKFNKQSLKGRVMFGHCKITDTTISELPAKEYILSSPKASFYPFYLKNENKYTDKNAELSGFKKYPVHKKENINPHFPNDKEDVRTTIKPLPDKSIFIGKIRFHNLKKMEIGALLSALTFHNQSDLYSHTLGGAKPFGYGKVKIEIEKLNYLKSDIKEYLYDFEQTMNKHLNGSWKDKNAIWLYMAMSSTIVSKERNEQYEYPSLEAKFTNERGEEDTTNEFSNPELKLPEYTKNEVKITSITDEVKAEQEKKIKEAYEKIKDSNNIEELQQFLKEHSKSIYENEIRGRLEKLEEKFKYETLKSSTNIEDLEAFVRTCNNEEFKKTIQERITKLQQENKAKETEEKAGRALNIEPKTYRAILAKMREFSKLKLAFNTEQKQELLNDIIVSFGDENSAKEYNKGYNKNESRLKGAWREFRKNGLSFEEITEIYNQFIQLKTH